MSLWHMDYLSGRQSRPLSDSRRAFYLPLNYLKNFRSGTSSRKRAITRYNFLIRKTYVNLFTKLLLFASSCEWSSFPLSPDAYLFLFSLKWHISFNGVTGFDPLMPMSGSHTYKIKFVFLVNLSYFNVIISPAKEPRRKEGESFLPLEIQVIYGYSGSDFYCEYNKTTSQLAKYNDFVKLIN